MAVEADKVVVQLVADVQGFNTQMTGAADGFQRSMGQINASSGAAATGQRALRSALNDNAAAAHGATTAMGGLASGSALATRELLVLMREATRGPGNFARMAGSMSILTIALQNGGQSITGLVQNLLTMFGVLQTTTDAEAAAAAAAAAGSEASVGAASARAEANIVAADTELALAQAAVRVAATSEEETAAQVRLAAAHDAVATAAAEANVATNALTLAQDRAAVAGAEAAAATSVGLTEMGVALSAVAVVAAAAFGVWLITRLGETHSAVDKLVQKLKEHAEKTRESEAADRAWANTLDGLIERETKLTDTLNKRLTTQAAVNRQQLEQAQKDLQTATVSLASEKTNLATLQRQLAKESLVTGTGAGGEAAAGEQARRTAILDAQISASKTNIRNLQQAITDSNNNIAKQLTVLNSDFADLSKNAADFGQVLDNNLGALTAHNHSLAGSSYAIAAANDAMKKAVTDAAAQGIHFDDLKARIDKLFNGLYNGKVGVSTYTAEVKKMAAALEAAAEAAKKAGDPVANFKKAVIGAEGTGPNRLGSSAAGFGQFMPSTWLSYFNKLFPDKADLSDAAKLAYRNVRGVAEAVIDKATDDYKAVLVTAGQKITEANLYTVHLLGSRDAAKLFAAAPGTPTSQFLSAAVLRGNPFLAGTAASARGAIAGRIGDSSGAVSAGAVALQKAIEEQFKSDVDFQDKMDKLNEELISAQMELVDNTQKKADYAVDDLKAKQQQADADIDARAQEKKAAGLDAQKIDAQAAQLHALNAAVTDQKIANVRSQEQLQLLDERTRAENQLLDFAQADLKFADEMARTQDEHRKLQLAILDALYQEKVNTLEAAKAKADAAKNYALAANIQAQIDRLPTDKAHDAAIINKQTMNPLQAWADQIPRTRDEIIQSLQDIEAHGFDTLAQSITGVITGTQSLGAAWKSISQQIVTDVVQVIIKMLILRTLANAFGMNSIGGFGNPFGNPIVDLGPDSPLTSTLAPISFDVPPLAGGGAGIIGGLGGTDNNLLSLNGQPIAWVSKGEGLSITPSNATAASPWSGGGQGLVLVQIEASEYFDGRVMQVTGPVIAQAATSASFGGAAMARNNLAKRQLHQLGSRG